MNSLLPMIFGNLFLVIEGIYLFERPIMSTVRYATPNQLFGVIPEAVPTASDGRLTVKQTSLPVLVITYASVVYKRNDSIGAVLEFIKDNKQSFCGQQSDGTFLEIDAIIFATGFDYKLSFVPESVTRIQNNRTELYKYMFPPHLKHPTFAVIGLVQSIGSVMPISEMQCRWFMKIMKEECELPSEEVMLEDIQAKRETMEKTYVKSQRHTLQCFWVEYMDELANQIGVKPDLWKLFFEDPALVLRCIFGPCVPAQYRLMGTGSWNGARATIKGSVQRCLFPTRTKLLPKNATGKENNSLYSINIPRHLHSYFVFLFVVFIFFCTCFV